MDDALDNSLFQWADANPSGEIYAANGSIADWSSVFCFNFTNNKTAGSNVVQRFNGTDLERSLGMDPEDVDGVDETFNGTFTGTISIGSNTFDRDSGCSLVSLNVNDVQDNLHFNETLLTDNNSIIYAAVMDQDETGFQGTSVDFQLLVGEDGDTTEATDYYFYVQLT